MEIIRLVKKELVKSHFSIRNIIKFLSSLYEKRAGGLVAMTPP